MKWLDPAWSPNFYAGQNDVRGIVVHHAAGTSIEAVAATFSRTERQASAHYAVKNGLAQQYVHEHDGAWHAGDYWANTHTIGIENVNSTGAPNWDVDERTIETCCELMADIAHRHGLYPLKRNRNVWGHRDFQSTYCPGVLYDRLDWMCERANTIYYDKYLEDAMAKLDKEDLDNVAIAVWSYWNKSIESEGDAYQILRDTRKYAGWDYWNKDIEKRGDAYQILRDIDTRLRNLEKKLK